MTRAGEDVDLVLDAALDGIARTEEGTLALGQPALERVRQVVDRARVAGRLRAALETLGSLAHLLEGQPASRQLGQLAESMLDLLELTEIVAGPDSYDSEATRTVARARRSGFEEPGRGLPSISSFTAPTVPARVFLRGGRPGVRVLVPAR